MEKRVCTKCGHRRLIKFFNKKGTGRTARCKHCLGEDNRTAYLTSRKRRKQVIDAVARRRTKLYAFIRSLKDDKRCVDCNRPYPYYVLDFDHLEDKQFGISQIAKRGWSEQRILDEVKKCDLVCANCHRERTQQRRMHP